jgi:hypothetical protein
MKISLISIVKGLTNREVKANSSVSTNKVISYSGQYYNGSDIVYVAGNSSSELVNKAMAGLNEKYRDVVPTFPSKVEPQWYPTDEVPTGATCKWVMPD